MDCQPLKALSGAWLTRVQLLSILKVPAFMLTIAKTPETPSSSPTPIQIVGGSPTPQNNPPNRKKLLVPLILVLLLVLVASAAFIFLKPKSLEPKAEEVTATTYTDEDAYVPQYYKDSEVPLYPKAEVKVLTDGDTGFGLFLKSPDKFSKVKEFYLKELKASGWETEVVQDNEVNIHITASKEKKYVSLTLTKNLVYKEVAKDSPKREVSEGGTTINISINKT